MRTSSSNIYNIFAHDNLKFFILFASTGNCLCQVQIDVLDKLLCADDLAENAKSEAKMQGAVDRMSKACGNFHLTISTAPGTAYSEPTDTLNGQKLVLIN